MSKYHAVLEEHRWRDFAGGYACFSRQFIHREYPLVSGDKWRIPYDLTDLRQKLTGDLAVAMLTNFPNSRSIGIYRQASLSICNYFLKGQCARGDDCVRKHHLIYQKYDIRTLKTYHRADQQADQQADHRADHRGFGDHS